MKRNSLLSLPVQMEMSANRIYTKRPAMRSALIFLIALAATTISCNVDKPLPAGAKVDSIVVIKHNREMWVYSNTRLLKIYKIALGSQPAGHKQQEGDMRTPEGIYYINDKNPNSQYYKNLGISYPNKQDEENARKLGRSPGGDIKIHGLPNRQLNAGSFHRLRDWTHGCIAVTNAEMDELYKAVTVGTVINIQP
ncbi:MAG TPA: L,D-transpeptidase family protein [Flavipsychrobacter sp.]